MKDVAAQEFETGPAEHGAFDGLQSVDPPLDQAGRLGLVSSAARTAAKSFRNRDAKPSNGVPAVAASQSPRVTVPCLRTSAAKQCARARGHQPKACPRTPAQPPTDPSGRSAEGALRPGWTEASMCRLSRVRRPACSEMSGADSWPTPAPLIGRQ